MRNARIGGILTIVSGAFGVLWLLWTLFVTLFLRAMLSSTTSSRPLPPEFFTFMTVFYAGIGIFFALVGIFGIIGGVFALKRRNWGLALAGAIAGSVTFFPVGIPAIIYVTMARPEFSSRIPPSTSASPA